MIIEKCTYCGTFKCEGSICACGQFEPGISPQTAPEPPDIERIVAVDFDKTICDSAYPALGELKPGVIEALTKIRALGYWIVIWSCRTCKFHKEVFAPNEVLDMNRPVIKEMIEYLHIHRVPYDAIDDGTKGKVYAAHYIDDKAIRFENNWTAIAEFIAGKEATR